MARELFESSHEREDPSLSPHSAGRLSYSQCGEDVLVHYIFYLRGIAKPTYLDIGAHDPFYLSNTAMLYGLGSRGINVEANPDLIANFHRWRPDDVNIQAGVSPSSGVAEFFVMEEAGLSTFSKEECEVLQSHGHQVKRIDTIEMITVQQILDAHCDGKFPDFFSLDAEGVDFAILASIDYKRSLPKVICVEAADYSPNGTGKRRSDLIDFLTSKGYTEYANTNLNAIMVRNDFWFV